jgi:hypothetical protein
MGICGRLHRLLGSPDECFGLDPAEAGFRQRWVDRTESTARLARYARA